MASRIFPSVQDIQDYARAVNGGGRAPIAMPGQSQLTAPLANQKPRLKMLSSGQILIQGADYPNVFFAPQQPLQPVAQSPDYAVIGRPWDYPVGYNTRVTPRSGMAIGFQTMYALADGYDVLRGMIERVKDKIVTKPWAILPKDKKQKADARCLLIQNFLQSPDKMNTWVDWSRMLLEQVIVLDAPAIYIRRTYGGQAYSLEVLDGAMIAPKIMADGRKPPPDVGPAYQQVIKNGLPAADYITPMPFGMRAPVDPDGYPYPELLYKPRNPRVNSVYGYSPVEQMITTITIALSREAYLGQYYTSGATPDLIFTCPKEWNSAQIASFKVWWDSVLAGNLANRRGTMFVPDGAKPIDTKEKALTDQTDEWLVRIMCFFLGLNPMPFLKQMNRGQEKTHHDEAASEGLGPWQHWFVDLFSRLIPTLWGWDDLEFRWEEEEATDPLEQAQIDQILVSAKIYHPDELRARRGDDAMTDDLRDQMDMATFSAALNSTILPDDQQQAKDQAAQDLAASKPAPVVGAPAAKPAEKIDVHNHFDIGAPAVTVHPPTVNVDSPVTIAEGAVKVTLPEMKAADVFVDVGATNVRVDAQKSATIGKTITAQRMADGTMRGTISDGVTKTVTSTKVDGKTVVKIEE